MDYGREGENRVTRVNPINDKTLGGIPVEPVYDPTGNEAERYEDALGAPGSYPFTRGIYPTMYRGRLWTMRQYAGYAGAEETNERFRYLLSKGQTGLSVAFDLPTQIGYDSDHEMAVGEVGKVGVAIDSLEDMETLLKDIPLDEVSTSMTINAPAAVLLAMYVAVGDKQGVPRTALKGTIQNDILKEYIARGTYIFPPKPSMRLVADVISWCTKHVPKWNTISISGYHIREAGATAVQEIAFTFANAMAYVEALLRNGNLIDQFAPRLSFFFNAHIDLFEEVAKFRAARRLWAKIMRDVYKASDPRSMMMRFHAQTAGSALTAQQPYNNVVRITLQALAAILGGAQSLHTNSMDEALALPSEQSALLALRTQQILAYESGVPNTVDPLGGSYFIEQLTDRIEREAEEYISEIQRLGGAVRAIEEGYMQREIHESAYRYQREVESGERIVVGVNEFTQEESIPVGLTRVDPEVAERQTRKLARLRSRRDNSVVNETLRRLEEAAQGTANLMPYILDCVKNYATLGEICDRLRRVFGEYNAPNEV